MRPSGSSSSRRFPMRSMAIWRGIGTSRARSGRCSTRLPTSCCYSPRSSRSASSRSAICGPSRSGFRRSSSAATPCCSAAIACCVIFRCRLKSGRTGRARRATFFTLAAIIAVLLRTRENPTLTLCALGAGFALICTVIYVRQGLRLLTHSGHTRAATSK